MAEQSELWSDDGKNSTHYEPLAVRMRPRRLDEIVGQEHIFGKGCLLPRLIERDSFGSLLLFGPPGCGKTTLAEVIAAETKSQFRRLNAVLSNVGELRSILQTARGLSHPPILFIDEIHRFNRAQQDSLLPDVERGTVRLIGATTHTPTVYVIAPLLSRSHLFQLEPLSAELIKEQLCCALNDCERGLGNTGCKVDDVVLEALAQTCDGDLRRALNALETMVMGAPNGSCLTIENWEIFGKERHLRYDRDEGEHHATISAYIKSMRGGDPDSALYWLTKMLQGGEDPRFIARRMVIFASEDVGMADPRALPLASACYAACETIGMPECGINLAHGTVYLATALKSNSAYAAYGRAQEEIRTHAVQPVPEFLRNQPKSLASRLGVEKYLYSHEYEDNVSGQRYMVDPKKFYYPKEIGAEKVVADRLNGQKSPE
ncbi:MAG: replication-associated recombination protein A [Puniceicoccales bacterium]|jgi:putative ATPase|nr:replication-associated recombination protein A [Puniceicoccales bacterium]